MTQRAPGRKRALIALTAVALLALAAMAPVASAQISTDQIPGGDAVGTVTDTVTDTTSGGGSGGTLTDTVDKTVDSTNDTAEPATGSVGAVVDTTDDKVKDTTGQTKKTVDNTTSETGTAVNNTVDEASGTGGAITNPLLTAKDPRAKDIDGNTPISERERNLESGGSKRAAYRGDFAGSRASRKADERGKRESMIATEKKTRTSVSAMPASVEAPQGETFIAQLAEAAGEAAEKLAFPLGLALMVGAFLMLQGRIDRKDAKLVLAPIDSEQDLLSFQ